VSTALPPRTDRIRWADLSVQSTAILRQVVAPIHLEGYTTTEVAKRLEIAQGAVKLLIAYFANEVSALGRPESQSGRGEAEIDLRQFIAAHG
jgi:DNA-directed RNA polymerase specialized sigma24 family protein